MSPWWLDLQQKWLVTTSPRAPITCLFRGGAIISSVTVHAFTGLSPNIVNAIIPYVMPSSVLQFLDHCEFAVIQLCSKLY